MPDTTEEFRQKQIEINMAMTPQERGKMAMEMIECGYALKNNIIAQYPPPQRVGRRPVTIIP